MGIDPGTDIVIRRRHLYTKDTNQPAEIGASYLPLEVAGGTFLEEPHVVPKTLFLCVEDLTGRRYTRARDQWIARMPTADETNTLELPTGAPVIHIARDEDGDVLEVSESIWPAASSSSTTTPSNNNPNNPPHPAKSNCTLCNLTVWSNCHVPMLPNSPP